MPQIMFFFNRVDSDMKSEIRTVSTNIYFYKNIYYYLVAYYSCRRQIVRVGELLAKREIAFLGNVATAGN